MKAKCRYKASDASRTTYKHARKWTVDSQVGYKKRTSSALRKPV
jgi:hypothetical protein